MSYDVIPSSGAHDRAWARPAPMMLAVVALFAAAAAVHLVAPLTGDVSWLLTVCERMLDGQRLYLDIAEVNPPMSAWIYWPWVWLARRIGAAPETVVVFAVLGFAALTIEAAGRTLVRAGLIERDAGWWRIVAAFAFAVAPISTYAQREHVAILAVLPLLACLASRAASRVPAAAEQAIAGLLGGLALSIKPHIALGVLVPALVVAAWRRSLRPIVAPECLIAGVAVVAYGAVVAAVHPAYLSDMLPLAATVYVPNRLPFDKLMLTPEIVAVATEVAALVLLRRRFAGSPLGVVLIAAMAGFAIGYALQGKGWLYHLLPVWTLAILAFGLSLSARPLFWRTPGATRVLTFALVAYLIAAPAGEYLLWRDPYRPLIDALLPAGPHPKIALLTDSLKLGSPLHRQVGGALVSRGPSLWITGNALALQAGETDAAKRALWDAAIARERRAFRDDVLRTPPDAFLVEEGKIDWLGWARADPALAAALDGYNKTATAFIGPVGVAVWRRAAGARPDPS